MLPIWGLAAMPVALLAVTWAWRGDWLLDRPAPGRYVRLGLILITTFGMLLGGYAGVRAWGIPDPGPIAEPSVWIATASLPPDRNAAELYREAAGGLDYDYINANIVDSRSATGGIPQAAPGSPRPDPPGRGAARLPVRVNQASQLGERGGSAADDGARRTGDRRRARLASVRRTSPAPGTTSWCCSAWPGT